MHLSRTAALLVTVSALAACKRAPAGAERVAVEPPHRAKPALENHHVAPPPPKHDGQMYTTYFYTAAEAVVHGYEDGTKVRIVSLADPATHRKAGTIWEGTVGVGETKLVPTGAGVFGFLSDKKAAILVGTPSSCAVVGYFVKDEAGRYRSNRFFTQLPSGTAFGKERLVVWAYDPADVTIRIPKTQKVVATRSLRAGERLELPFDTVQPLGNQVLEITSTRNTVAAEVYYDQGFIVPSATGSGAGTDFYTFVGSLTAGSNDLDLIALADDANVTVTDLDAKRTLYKGKVKAGGIHVLNLVDKYVRVTSDRAIELAVAAFEVNGSGYAEHHFATGSQGGGIDNDFEVTTSSGLWLFSYFADNAVTVTNARTGAKVFAGTMTAGSGHELAPGVGLYRVHASKGLSVMGGASACGADYSPAAGMFAVDEAMLQVIQQVTEARIEDAHARGITLTPEAAAAAPISKSEWDRYGAPAKAAYKTMSVDEANQRAAAMKQK